MIVGIPLTDALKVNTILINLDLTTNNIADDGVKYLCEVLKVNEILVTCIIFEVV